MSDLLIYGATGYTVSLIAREAANRGLRPVLAGRNAEAVAGLAGALGLDYRAFPLDAPDALAAAGVRGVRAVLNCAGPFSRTARPLADACLKAGAYYLDITGEAALLEVQAGRDAEARAAAVVLLPGVGFDVGPGGGRRPGLPHPGHGVRPGLRAGTPGRDPDGRGDWRGRPPAVERAGPLVRDLALGRGGRPKEADPWAWLGWPGGPVRGQVPALDGGGRVEDQEHAGVPDSENHMPAGLPAGHGQPEDAPRRTARRRPGRRRKRPSRRRRGRAGRRRTATWGDSPGASRFYHPRAGCAARPAGVDARGRRQPAGTAQIDRARRDRDRDRRSVTAGPSRGRATAIQKASLVSSSCGPAFPTASPAGCPA
jgi:hypothetical protein